MPFESTRIVAPRAGSCVVLTLTAALVFPLDVDVAGWLAVVELVCLPP